MIMPPFSITQHDIINYVIFIFMIQHDARAINHGISRYSKLQNLVVPLSFKLIVTSKPLSNVNGVTKKFKFVETNIIVMSLSFSLAGKNSAEMREHFVARKAHVIVVLFNMLCSH